MRDAARMKDIHMSSHKKVSPEGIIVGALLVGWAGIAVRIARAHSNELSQIVFEGLSLVLNRHKPAREGESEEWVTKHYGWVEAPNWDRVHSGTVRVPRKG